MADVFISYARPERGIAEQIATRLQEYNVSVFFDVDRLEVGEVFSDRIDAEIKRCGAVLGLWSPLSLSRPWVKLECDIGKRRGVLVPAAIRPFTEMDVPAAFWNVQYIDLTHLTAAPTDPNWIQLLKTLSRHLARSDLAHIERTVGAKAAPLEDLHEMITSAVEDRVKAIESKSAQDIAEARFQLDRVTRQLQEELATQRRLLEDRIQLTDAKVGLSDDAEINRLADRLDERVRESEYRSADAISQIGEQVARAVERLQNQHAEVARGFEERLSLNSARHEARLEAMLQEVAPALEQVSKDQIEAIAPIKKIVASLVSRLDNLEQLVSKLGVEKNPNENS